MAKGTVDTFMDALEKRSHTTLLTTRSFRICDDFSKSCDRDVVTKEPICHSIVFHAIEEYHDRDVELILNRYSSDTTLQEPFAQPNISEI